MTAPPVRLGIVQPVPMATGQTVTAMTVPHVRLGIVQPVPMATGQTATAMIVPPARLGIVQRVPMATGRNAVNAPSVRQVRVFVPATRTKGAPTVPTGATGRSASATSPVLVISRALAISRAQAAASVNLSRATVRGMKHRHRAGAFVTGLPKSWHGPVYAPAARPRSGLKPGASASMTRF
jgi:hypothetical protein